MKKILLGIIFLQLAMISLLVGIFGEGLGFFQIVGLVFVIAGVITALMGFCGEDK